MSTSARFVLTGRMTFASGFAVTVLCLTIVAGAVLAVLNAPSVIWTSIVLVPPVVMCWMLRPLAREMKSLTRAPLSFDAQEVGAVEYAGSTSTLVLTVKCARLPTMLAVEQLCRTHTGRWFSFYCYIPLGGGAAHSHRVEPRSPDFARGSLLTHEALYRRYFGLKATARTRSIT